MLNNRNFFTKVKKSDGLKQQLELLQQSKQSQEKAVEQQGQSLQLLQQQVANLQKQVAEQKAGVDVNQNNSVISDAALLLLETVIIGSSFG